MDIESLGIEKGKFEETYYYKIDKYIKNNEGLDLECLFLKLYAHYDSNTFTANIGNWNFFFSSFYNLDINEVMNKAKLTIEKLRNNPLSYKENDELYIWALGVNSDNIDVVIKTREVLNCIKNEEIGNIKRIRNLLSSYIAEKGYDKIELVEGYDYSVFVNMNNIKVNSKSEEGPYIYEKVIKKYNISNPNVGKEDFIKTNLKQISSSRNTKYFKENKDIILKFIHSYIYDGDSIQNMSDEFINLIVDKEFVEKMMNMYFMNEEELLLSNGIQNTNILKKIKEILSEDSFNLNIYSTNKKIDNDAELVKLCERNIDLIFKVNAEIILDTTKLNPLLKKEEFLEKVPNTMAAYEMVYINNISYIGKNKHIERIKNALLKEDKRNEVLINLIENVFLKKPIKNNIEEIIGVLLDKTYKYNMVDNNNILSKLVFKELLGSHKFKKLLIKGEIKINENNLMGLRFNYIKRDELQEVLNHYIKYSKLSRALMNFVNKNEIDNNIYNKYKDDYIMNQLENNYSNYSLIFKQVVLSSLITNRSGFIQLVEKNRDLEFMSKYSGFGYNWLDSLNKYSVDEIKKKSQDSIIREGIHNSILDNDSSLKRIKDEKKLKELLNIALSYKSDFISYSMQKLINVFEKVLSSKDIIDGLIDKRLLTGSYFDLFAKKSSAEQLERELKLLSGEKNDVFKLFFENVRSRNVPASDKFKNFGVYKELELDFLQMKELIKVQIATEKEYNVCDSIFWGKYVIGSLKKNNKQSENLKIDILEHISSFGVDEYSRFLIVGYDKLSGNEIKTYLQKSIKEDDFESFLYRQINNYNGYKKIDDINYLNDIIDVTLKFKEENQLKVMDILSFYADVGIKKNENAQGVFKRLGYGIYESEKFALYAKEAIKIMRNTKTINDNLNGGMSVIKKRKI